MFQFLLVTVVALGLPVLAQFNGAFPDCSKGTVRSQKSES
jgi:hypothetical protein